MSRIFCVEDDSNIRELIEYTLVSAGFEVCGFETGEKFFSALEEKPCRKEPNNGNKNQGKPDLVLLDIMLPDMDGMEILRKLKANRETKDLPVIMLTAKSERMDKIRGLDSGADDYITKPFDVLELISRVRALMRRAGSNSELSGSQNEKSAEEQYRAHSLWDQVGMEEERLSYKDLCIDHAKRRVTVGDEEVTLTYKEYQLLYMLMEADGRVVTRERIISKIWDTNFEGESRTLDVHIRTLRQKLGKAGEYIETVRNVGYKVG